MERRSIQLRPNRVVTRSTQAIPPSQRNLNSFSDDPRIVEAIEKKPENHFGTLAHHSKTLDMDLLTKRILRKGSKEFEPPIKELIGEVPPGHENGILLTHSQVCRMFDVTGMTVYDWRKRLNLPVIVLSGGKRPPVRYDEGVVLAWAALHGRRVEKTDYREWM
jgi:hypothetical protein